MKHLTICFILSFLTQISFAQDYMDDIAQKACDCVNDLDEDADQSSNFTMKLGLCMIEASTPYKDELLEDHGIDFDKIDQHGERLGEMIGIRMATVCPAVILAAAEKMEEEESPSESEFTNDEILYNTSGKVIKVDKGLFVEFTIRDDNNRNRKYHWLSFVDANIDIIESYQDLTGRSVNLTYRTEEFFDARIGEYREFNVIVEFELP